MVWSCEKRRLYLIKLFKEKTCDIEPLFFPLVFLVDSRGSASISTLMFASNLSPDYRENFDCFSKRVVYGPSRMIIVFDGGLLILGNVYI